ncbi:Co2+/Mg2+ efflux protein ApaG [Algivirga pacifica]|uniref:Co2+/Mg2+ efflux protein ApaG n=1 Tax=Algivirga pacifica TaxID=1162670 RepID=A0ABP9D3Y4_9BACT
MVEAITHDIRVSIESSFQEEYANIQHSNFVYTYEVTIENLGDYSIQLISREWYIVDANGKHTHVSGEGVIGLQPIIDPQGKHCYESGCHLSAEMGKMYGKYFMKRLIDGAILEVEIPVFFLIPNYKLN